MAQYFAKIENGEVVDLRKTTQERINANPSLYPGVWSQVEDIEDYPASGWLHSTETGFEEPFRTDQGHIFAKISHSGRQVTLIDPAYEAEVMAWVAPTHWYENPVMIGDQRTYDGKEWESLVDYNVWTPPVNWREIVSEGYPDWVQPTGAQDAYPLGARVSHNGQDWENTGSAANVWEPGVFGWVVI